MSVLDSHLSLIHQKQELEYPLADPKLTNDFLIRELQRRSQRMSLVRQETVGIMSSLYPNNREYALGAEAIARVGVYLDEILIAQLLDHDPSSSDHDGDLQLAKSWGDYAEGASHNLVRGITEIGENEHFRLLREKSPFFIQILKQVSEKVTFEKEPAKLEAAAAEIERLVVASARGGYITPQFILSNYITHPNSDPNKHATILNPDVRLLIPDDEQARADFNEKVKMVWDILSSFYPEEKKAALPDDDIDPYGIFGNGVVWAGAQIVSYTPAEALRKANFSLSRNILRMKVAAHLSRVIELFGDWVPYEDYLDYIEYMYLFHELGHNIFEVWKAQFEEIATDIPANLLIMHLMLEKQLPAKVADMKCYIKALIAESTNQLSTVARENYFSDGYGISSFYLLNQLLVCGVVVRVGSSWDINVNVSNIYLFMKSLEEMHEYVLKNRVSRDEARANEYIDNLRTYPHPDLEKLLVDLLPARLFKEGNGRMPEPAQTLVQTRLI